MEMVLEKQKGDGCQIDSPERLEHLKESARKIGKELGDASQATKDAAREGMSELSKVSEEQLDTVLTFVRRRPLTSMLIAASAGFFGAAILRR